MTSGSTSREIRHVTQERNMSDDNMSDNEEDYDLEYSEDDDSQPDVDLENQYYNSKVSFSS